MTSPRPRILVAPTSTDAAVVLMRELRRAGIAVHGADDGYLPRGLRSRHCDHWHRVTHAADRHVKDYLPEIVASARPHAVLPVNTPATLAAIALRDSDPTAARTNLPTAAAFAAAYDKRECLAACCRLGIPSPKVHEPAAATAVLRRSRGTKLVVKPRLDFGGGRGVRFVSDEAALGAAVSYCDERLGGAIVQEYIPGDVTRLAMLLVLFGPDSRLVAAFTSRKLRQYPSAGGAMTAGESTAEVQLLEQLLPLFEAWQWRGPAEVDLKLDERDGRYKVLEVNPRLPAYLRLVVDCGLDLPALAAGLALDPAAVSPVPFPAYVAGRNYVCPGPFGRGLLAELQAGGPCWSKLAAALDDARGTRLGGVWDDPLPFLGRLVHWREAEADQASTHASLEHLALANDDG